MAKVFLISDLHVDVYLGNKPKVDSVKQLLDRYLCPADIISVAGDISNYASCTARVLTALSEMYPHVVWTPGNHDMVSHNGENSYLKIHRLLDKVNHLQNVHYMNGIPTPINDALFGGSMGQCDFSYAEKHFGMSKEYMEIQWRMKWYDGRYWNIGTDGPLDVWAEEYSKLDACVNAGCKFMVSHFGPSAHNVDARFHNAYTGFFYFDGLNLLSKMEPGSVWHFGHTHDYFNDEINGVRLMCNPFGLPEESRNKIIPKEEFVINV